MAVYTYQSIRAMARANPKELIELLYSDERPWVLSLAAEYAGSVSGAEPALLRLLSHKSALVREGAVMGLSVALGRTQSSAIYSRLAEVAANDPSPGVRTVAACSVECLLVVVTDPRSACKITLTEEMIEAATNCDAFVKAKDLIPDDPETD